MNSICHKNTNDYYEITKQKIEALTNIYSITSARPSESNSSLTPNFEKEFRDLSDESTLGGLIYYNFRNKLKVNIDKINDIQNTINNYISNHNLETNLNTAYSNIKNFGQTISLASNIMITNFLSDKKMILNFFNFMYLFITSSYLIVWLCLLICLIVFECEKNKYVYYLSLGLINLLLLLAIWEIVLSFLFQGIHLFCKQSPRAMEFIFTGDYMVNGNTENYPPKFGNKDPIQVELFKICLNDNGNLFKNSFSEYLLDSTFNQNKNIRIQSNNLYNALKEEINLAKMQTNQYSIYNNYSYIYSSILKLEEIQNNLYLVSDGFENDDIRKIINNIRNNLISSTCLMTYEYYVIKKEDCPKNSFVLNQISNTIEYINHCYIIQDLLPTSKASYSASGCDNSYINKAILFIQEINNLLKNRINQLKEIQKYYILTWNNMYSEINSINNELNNIQILLEDEINNKYQMGNCSSVRFDLIDFSYFIYNKIGYKLRIMLIFSSLNGIIGMFLFYSVLWIFKYMNYIKNENFYNDNIYDGNLLSNNNSKLNLHSKNRKIRPSRALQDKDNVYIKKIYKNENKKTKNDINWDIKEQNKNKTNIVYNNFRRIEMRNLKNKNE